MLDGLPIGAVTNGIGVVGVVLLVGWMVFTGRLVPKRYFDLEVKRGDALVAAVSSLTEQLRELTTDKDLGVYILRGVQAKADAARGDEP